MVKKIIRVRPSGLCAGVERALKILQLEVEKNLGRTIYCKHQIVHNQKVVEEFEKQGVKFVEELSEIPDGAVVVLSAHGTSPEALKQAAKKDLKVVDAVCPLVTKVHLEAKSFSEKGYFIVYLGHKNHPEAIGVLGEVKGEAKLISNLEEAKSLIIKGKAVLLTQTTLGVDETKEIIDYLVAKWPEIVLPAGKDICFSTSNRQNAVKELVKKVELMLVVGSINSSNSNRLRELGEKEGVESYLVDGPEDLKEKWFEGKERVGITAGASVPQRLVDKVIAGIVEKFGGVEEELAVIKEEVKFKL